MSFRAAARPAMAVARSVAPVQQTGGMATLREIETR